jgi:hypothetical protein
VDEEKKKRRRRRGCERRRYLYVGRRVGGISSPDLLAL